MSTSFLTSAGAIVVNPPLLSIALRLFAAILSEALLEARREVLRFLQEKARGALFVRGPEEERGQ